MNTLDHLLACIGEESGEVQQAAGKSLRFGIYDRNPNTMKPNFSDLRGEVHDVLAIYYMICDELEEDSDIDPRLLQDKIDKVKRYMKYAEQREQERLTGQDTMSSRLKRAPDSQVIIGDYKS